MNFRPLILAIALFAGATGISAKMTDQQVIEYIKQQTANGKDERTIGRELLARGVTQAQVKRIQQQQQLRRTGAPAANAATTVAPAATGMRTAAPNDAENPLLEDVITVEDVAPAAPAEQPDAIYGHNVFNGRSISFEPNQNAATPKDYRLGPGDELVIDIWGESEDHLRQTITPEGSIMISQLGPLYLNGMTIDQAADHVRTAFASKYAGVGNNATDISVTLGQLRTIQVDIMGEVSLPGTYRLSPFSTVFHAIYKAGGINDIGSMRQVEVMRNGRRVATVDIYDFLFNGSQKGNIRLQEGDMIIVPPFKNIVNVTGNVKRPMRYELKDGETLADLIGYAGGFNGDAYAEMVRVERRTGRENELYNVSDAEYNTYRLNNGDEITVGTILDRYANRVEVRGAVMRPGTFAIGDGISTVRDLIRKADGLAEDAYTARAILYREAPDLSQTVVPVDLQKVLAGSAPDIKLERNDVLVISSVNEINERGALTISGLVANPGQYPYASNMTVEDLILAAGGLLEGASYSKIDVSRRIVDPMATKSSDRIAEVYTFTLKNGLLMGSDHEFKLNPYDIVEVRRSPNYVPQKTVTVDGEVTFSGGYVLATRNERLSTIISRAGGLTTEAYVRGAHLLRRMTDAEILARDETLRLARQSSGNDSISVEKLDISDVYSVGIDLEKALAQPGSTYDIVLRPDDHLVVPEMTSTVKISGEVMFPNTVTFENGKKIKDYIDQAGGYGNRANKGKTFIVYMNGTVARAKRNTPVEPGAHIIVPSKPEGKGLDWARILSVTSALGSLGTMAAAIAAIVKN